ncbi:hypothetical protein SAMN02949497_3597 [Methylomagnum ishizawai]|uniref:mRNA-degrading endonuclease RelE, toxin component of the RelBE toxin-antitoxin system n=1 Tax=Methylomagnum ishizawai TaxID=1760988 RepID=A0A1Y6D0N4_9GAMM|nr:hypothetical protein [Methylomagnum ishizawai]SMF96207.1 hypothetical protein SAMN02949497_3597 [Methylomagnum ishizawai]
MVTISPQAAIAIRSLLPQDRNRIEYQTHLLARFPDDEYILRHVQRLTGEKSTYLLRATPELRILFRYEQGETEVLDVVAHRRLEKMFYSVY